MVNSKRSECRDDSTPTNRWRGRPPQLPVAWSSCRQPILFRRTTRNPWRPRWAGASWQALAISRPGKRRSWRHSPSIGPSRWFREQKGRCRRKQDFLRTARQREKLAKWRNKDKISKEEHFKRNNVIVIGLHSRCWSIRCLSLRNCQQFLRWWRRTRWGDRFPWACPGSRCQGQRL